MSCNFTPLSGGVWTWAIRGQQTNWATNELFSLLPTSQEVRVQTSPLRGVTLWDFSLRCCSFSYVCATVAWLKASPATLSLSGVTFPSCSQCRASGIGCCWNDLRCSDLVAHQWLSWFAVLTYTQKAWVQSAAVSGATLQDFFQFLWWKLVKVKGNIQNVICQWPRPILLW